MVLVKTIYIFTEVSILNGKGEIIGRRKNKLEGYFTLRGLHKSKELDLDTLTIEYYTTKMEKNGIAMASHISYINKKTLLNKGGYSIKLYFEPLNK